MSDLAFNLLGNLAYSYGRNPDAIGVKDGQPVNANGEVVPLMKQPNLIARMFNPDAGRAMQLNSQIANSGIMSQIERDNLRKITGQNIDTVPWQEWSSANDANLGTPQKEKSNLLPSQDRSIDDNLYTGMVGQKPLTNYHNANGSVMSLAGQHNSDLANRQRELEITRHIDSTFMPTQVNQQLSDQAKMPYAASTGQLLGHAANVTAGTANRQSIFNAAKQDKENALTLQNLANDTKQATDITSNELEYAKIVAAHRLSKLPQDITDEEAKGQYDRLKLGLDTDLLKGDIKNIPNLLTAKANKAAWDAENSQYGAALPEVYRMLHGTDVSDDIVNTHYKDLVLMAEQRKMQSIRDMANGGASTGPSVPLSSGRHVQANNPVWHPAGQIDSVTTEHPSFQVERGYKPVEGLDGIFLNEKEGKAKNSAGEDVTEQLLTNPVWKKAIADELDKRESEKNDAVKKLHDSLISTQIHNLKVQQHLADVKKHGITVDNSGLIGYLGNKTNIRGNIADSLDTLRHNFTMKPDPYKGAELATPRDLRLVANNLLFGDNQ